MMPAQNGTFTISLDFEMHWGVLPRLSVEQYIKNLKNTPKAIEWTLSLFDKYSIHATWASVGFLFCGSKQELLNRLPSERPTYTNEKYNSYRIIDELGENEQEAPYHFSPTLLQEIIATKGQEIGTHTFSHFFCLEEGQTPEQFREDLEAAKEVANKFNLPLRSIVFPRNQFNESYLEICKELGICVIRGNQDHYIYQARRREDESKSIRILRFLDAYLNISGYQLVEPTLESGLVNIAASRFLRPYHPKLKLFEKLRLNRIKKEMTVAARQKKIYHLWWHPHNFGKHTVENLAFLEAILQHFQFLKEEYGFQSMSMGEIGERVLANEYAS